jgi:hypothetical protein
MRSPAPLFLASALALVVLSAACTDPLRDQAIGELGPEDVGGPGPEHRVGQPCLLCHSAGGPASSKPFAVAGTVYENEAPGSPGAPDIEVRFVDAENGAPRLPIVTNRSGNFYVYESEWPDLTYPFRVALFKGGALAQPMTTTVNREGSCNYCHRPNAPEPRDDRDVELARRYYGQIYVTPGGGGEEGGEPR